MEIWKFAAFAIVCALLCAVLKQHGAGQASLLALAGCFWLLRRARLSGLAPWGVSLLAGGALGNIIDRVLYGAVTDMFELLFIRFYIFNVADVGVVAGAILCGISLLFRPQDWSKR